MESPIEADKGCAGIELPRLGIVIVVFGTSMMEETTRQLPDLFDDTLSKLSISLLL